MKDKGKIEFKGVDFNGNKIESIIDENINTEKNTERATFEHFEELIFTFRKLMTQKLTKNSTESIRKLISETLSKLKNIDSNINKGKSKPFDSIYMTPVKKEVKKISLGNWQREFEELLIEVEKLETIKDEINNLLIGRKI